MAYFVVFIEHGPTWDDSRELREQESWDEHAAFMDALVDDGFILLGGPLGDGTHVLHIVDAANEEDVRERLSGDPWAPTDKLRITNVEPWDVLLRREGL